MTRLDSRAALSCHEYLHKQNAPNLFDLSKKQVDNPLVEALKKSGGEHEDLVIRFLKTLDIPFVQIDLSQTVEGIELASLDALQNSSVSMIFGASLGYHLEVAKFGKAITRRTSRPDVLFKIGVDASNNPIWAPVDIKSHEAIEENKSNELRVTNFPTYDIKNSVVVTGRLLEKDAIQLAHYVTHLSEIGFPDDSNMAGIIGKNYQSIVWADLSKLAFGIGDKSEVALTKYSKQFQKAQVVVDESLNRARNPRNLPVTIARRVSGDFGCPTCEFKIVCREEMEAFDNGNGHVTLLSEVTASKAEANFPNIESIKNLATEVGLSPFGMKATVRAQVWINKKSRLLNQSEPLGLPEFDIEIDIDLENSQAALQEAEFEEISGKNTVYLYGFGIHDRTLSKNWNTAEFDYYDDYRDNDEAEVSVLARMWERLRNEVVRAESQGTSIGIFHYSNHEVKWWEKYATRYQGQKGVPTLEEVDDFVSKYFFDLLKFTRKVAFPVTGYSIKSLAPLAGFAWSAEDASGGNSLIKYQQAVSKLSSEMTRKESINWLRLYNCDDVKATFAVRNYIRSLDL